MVTVLFVVAYYRSQSMGKPLTVASVALPPKVYKR
jgi:hypothetical protein